MLETSPRLLKVNQRGIMHLLCPCRPLSLMCLAWSSSLPFVLCVYQLGHPPCLKFSFQLFEPYPLLPKQHPDWQWEVGRCSPMNVGKTVDRIPTIKYRFNYTHCVHLWNLLISETIETWRKWPPSEALWRNISWILSTNCIGNSNFGTFIWFLIGRA